jgi:hypothetical protein
VIATFGRCLAGLVFAGCALTSLSNSQEAQLADFERCADKKHVNYERMRRHVVTVMLQQDLDLGETLAGLEVVEEVRSGRDVRLSSADAHFIDRHRFLEYGSPGFMGRPWFEALRACLEESHGYKIRRIEIH